MRPLPSRRRPLRCPDPWRRLLRRYAALERPPTCPADLADRVLGQLGLVETPQRPGRRDARGRTRAVLAVAALALAALLPAAPLPGAGWADLGGLRAPAQGRVGAPARSTPPPGQPERIDRARDPASLKGEAARERPQAGPGLPRPPTPRGELSR